jgi:hypothetical protein
MQGEKGNEGMARRPSGLIRQLDCLWEGVEELKERADITTEGEQPTEPTDPGDITVYFENGLTGA